MKRTFPVTALLGLLVAGHAPAGACTLRKLDIAPLSVENGDTYRGIAGNVEVLFHNDVKDHAVTLFPEPPMTVRHLRPASECLVDDGGAWGRDGVWLSADGRTLVTTESSGSSQDLVFRDTHSCAQVGRLGVAGMAWHVEDGALVLTGPGGQRRARRVPLDAACRPPVADTPRK